MSDYPTLDQMTRAVAYLREAGAFRLNSQWVDADSNPLGGDPTEAVQTLRRRTLKKVIEAKRERGESFYR